jgi:hypothetical protein
MRFYIYLSTSLSILKLFRLTLHYLTIVVARSIDANQGSNTDKNRCRHNHRQNISLRVYVERGSNVSLNVQQILCPGVCAG